MEKTDILMRQILLKYTGDPEVARRIISEIGITEARRSGSEVVMEGWWVEEQAAGTAAMAQWAIEHCEDPEVLERIAERGDRRLTVIRALLAHPLLSERGRWLLTGRRGPEPLSASAGVEELVAHADAVLTATKGVAKFREHSYVIRLLEQLISKGEQGYVDKFFDLSLKRGNEDMLVELLVHRGLRGGLGSDSVYDYITRDSDVILEIAPTVSAKALLAYMGELALHEDDIIIRIDPSHLTYLGERAFWTRNNHKLYILKWELAPLRISAWLSDEGRVVMRENPYMRTFLLELEEEEQGAHEERLEEAEVRALVHEVLRGDGSFVEERDGFMNGLFASGDAGLITDLLGQLDARRIIGVIANGEVTMSAETLDDLVSRVRGRVTSLELIESLFNGRGYGEAKRILGGMLHMEMLDELPWYISYATNRAIFEIITDGDADAFVVLDRLGKNPMMVLSEAVNGQSEVLVRTSWVDELFEEIEHDEQSRRAPSESH